MFDAKLDNIKECDALESKNTTARIKHMRMVPVTASIDALAFYLINAKDCPCLGRGLLDCLDYLSGYWLRTHNLLTV